MEQMKLSMISAKAYGKLDYLSNPHTIHFIRLWNELIVLSNGHFFFFMDDVHVVFDLFGIAFNLSEMFASEHVISL